MKIGTIARNNPSFEIPKNMENMPANIAEITIIKIRMIPYFKTGQTPVNIEPIFFLLSS